MQVQYIKNEKLPTHHFAAHAGHTLGEGACRNEDRVPVMKSCNRLSAVFITDPGRCSAAMPWGPHGAPNFQP